MNRHHHAFVIEAEEGSGVLVATAWAAQELGMRVQNNPDIVVARYGLLTVADARKIADMASGAPFSGQYKAVIISANRAYHEAQNALLKLFEEPPPNTYLFLIMPSLGGLLPTLRSRVQILNPYRDVVRPTLNVGRTTSYIPEAAEEFLKANKEKRSALIKKLTNGKDEEERREKREEAIALLNSIEASLLRHGLKGNAATLSDIALLRGYLYDRSAPVRMILEHVSLVIPKQVR